MIEPQWEAVEAAEVLGMLLCASSLASIWGWSLGRAPFVPWRSALDALGEEAPAALSARTQRLLAQGRHADALHDYDPLLALYVLELYRREPARALALVEGWGEEEHLFYAALAAQEITTRGRRGLGLSLAPLVRAPRGEAQEQATP